MRKFRSLLAVLLVATGAWAHEPFDCSSRMTAQNEHLEIIVTMGLDAARQILVTGGLSSSEVEAVVQGRAPHPPLDISTTLAGHFFEIKSGEATLEAQRVAELSEGMEVIFALTYPRPATGTLDVRANYYAGIPDLRNGSFVAVDEQGNQLGAALFSRANVTAQVLLPKIETAVPEPSVAASETPAPPTSDLPSLTPTPSPSSPSFGEYFKLGVEHILTGYDHLLFLCALLVVCRRVRPTLVIISCFTLAHSVTLGLAALNLVHISSRLIEPLIAFSIIVVAVKNMMRREAEVDRYWLASGFGLIHGFGFASVLRETGLGGDGSFLVRLLSFNLGVEAGQLAVMAVVVPVLFLFRRWPAFERRGTVALSLLIITISCYWLGERLIN